MPSKIKKLYNKARKGLKNIVLPKEHRAVIKAQESKILNDKLHKLTPKVVVLEQKIYKVENVKEDKKGIKEKIKSLKTQPIEKELKKGNVLKKGFKKLKGKIKSLNPIKSKKNKIIGSKRLAFLMTASTIIAILPTFSLAPLTALAITSLCIFSINLIAVKTLKKAIKQRKLAAESKEESTVTEPEKPEKGLQGVAIEPAKRDSEQMSK